METVVKLDEKEIAKTMEKNIAKKEKQYFLTYITRDEEGRLDFGNCIINLDSNIKINSIETVRAIEGAIMGKLGLDYVVLTSWRKL